MLISANALVFNEYGDTLLVQRDDTRSLAPPGGAVEIGELPPRTAERETQEETGLEVRTVRLVGLTYLPTRPHDYLFLSFRALQRGGELRTSPETPHTGFFRSYPLPEPMLAVHRRQIAQGLAHPGGPPAWDTHQPGALLAVGSQVLDKLVYPLLALRRRLKDEPAFVPPPDWQVVGTVILRNGRGEVLWLRDADDEDVWRLPAAVGESGETPWAAAARAAAGAGVTAVTLLDLSGVYPAPDGPRMTFAFTAQTGQSTLPAARAAFFAPGDEPPGATAGAIAQVAHSAGPEAQTQFALL